MTDEPQYSSRPLLTQEDDNYDQHLDNQYDSFSYQSELSTSNLNRNFDDDATSLVQHSSVASFPLETRDKLPSPSKCDDTSDEDSDSSIDELSMVSLNERRKQNVKRNAEKMIELDLMHRLVHGLENTRKTLKQPIPSIPDNSDSDESIDESKQSKRRGMLMSCSVSKRQLNMISKSPSNKSKDTIYLSSFSSLTPSLAFLNLRNDLDNLMNSFPGRQCQIQKLYAILSASTSVSAIPPPIFVTGVNGVGKSSVINSVIHAIQSDQNNFDNCRLDSRLSSTENSQLDGNHWMNSEVSRNVVIHAHVNCRIALSSSIDHILRSLLNQIKQELATISKRYNRWIKKRKADTCFELQQRKHAQERQSKNEIQRTRFSVQQKSKIAAADDEDDNDADDQNDDIKQLEDWESHVEKKQMGKRTKRYKKCITTDVNTNTELNANLSNAASTRDKVLTAVWKFGRSCQKLMREFNTNMRSLCSIIIVLDHADRLLSVTGKQAKNGSGNTISSLSFLAQLLLLPQTMGLSMTMIVVTNSILLEHTGLNNICSKGKINGLLRPICIHFPAYRGRDIMKRILETRHVKDLISVEGNATDCKKDVSFQHLCFSSFVDKLTQSLQDYTCNVKEYISLGRLLWTKYIDPVRRHNIETTMRLVARKMELPEANNSGIANVHFSKFQRAMIELLDRRIQPLLRNSLDRGLFVFAVDSPNILFPNRRLAGEEEDDHRQPFDLANNKPELLKYLLLAAYMCQVNRADKDRQLFSIQKNAKCSRKRSNADIVEDAAFGVSSYQQLSHYQQQPSIKTLRPRVFPLERLLSVFVSMVSLNARSTDDNSFGNSSQQGLRSSTDFEDSLNNLGTIQFNELLVTLRDVGLLHEIQSDGVVKMGQNNYWCSLTYDEAFAISKSINFPLERYILA